MELSEWVVYTVAEVLLVLVIACVLLFLHTKGLKVLISTLQGKLAKAISELREAKVNQPPDTKEQSYSEQLAVHIQATENYHSDQGADQPIELDIAPTTPKARLVAAMRHRFLRAELEGLADTPETPDWARITEHYEQFPQSSPIVSQPLIDTKVLLTLSYDEQRDEIERFKRLFTTMEGQWQTAKAKAEDYYNQLLSLIGDSSDPNHLALRQLAEAQLVQLDQIAASVSPPTGKASQLDLDNLKAINERQKDEISALQKKLASASTDEERLSITKNLERQLAQQLQFIKESEVCIDLLERELEDASRRIEQLEAQKPAQPANANQSALLLDKQHLNKQIQQLKGENEQLVNLTEHADAEQRRIVTVKNKEIEVIKSKFTELARRYKALANSVKKT